MKPKKIVLLLHQKESAFDSTNYVIQHLIREWENMGLTVQVVQGTRRFVSADLLIPHLDMTITPGEYRDFVLRYPNVINRHVVDISKSTTSTNLVGRNDSYSGFVIVKTDRNCGGLPERRLTLTGRIIKHWVPPKLVRRVASKLPRRNTESISWGRVKYLDCETYPVFPSVHEVPKEVFYNKNLVVERFIPELDGADYCVRYYYFFGDADANILLRSKKMVVKGDNTFKFEEVPIPSELHTIRQQLGFDYGKLDYVLRDGKVVLFDANPTPADRTLQLSGLAQKVTRRLAKGIWSKLTVGHTVPD